MLNFKTAIPFLLHPFPLVAVFLMALNDHYLKYQHPGFITDKLSDFLGCFYFPLFLLAIWVLVIEVYSRGNRFGFRLALMMCIVLTDVLFLSVKTLPVVNQWIVENFSNYFFKINVVADPTDLVALVMNPITYWWGIKKRPEGL